MSKKAKALAVLIIGAPMYLTGYMIGLHYRPPTVVVKDIEKVHVWPTAKEICEAESHTPRGYAKICLGYPGTPSVVFPRPKVNKAVAKPCPRFDAVDLQYNRNRLDDGTVTRSVPEILP